MLTDAHKQKVRQMFETQLSGKVEGLLLAAHEDQYSEATTGIMTELGELSDGKLTFRAVVGEGAQAEASKLGIDLLPCLLFFNEAGEDMRFRFQGAPIGYAFMALLDDIIDVSAGTTRLSEAGRAQIAAINEEVLIRVFSTPG